MVTAPHRAASEVGRDVLAAGGTAVEACVAVAAALAVVYPHMTGIGGDAFWLVRDPGGTIDAVHGCGRAAGAVRPEIYNGLSEVPTRGPLAAITVAGAISSWQAVLEREGCRIPLTELLAPATRMAREGVAVTVGGAAIARAKRAELRVQPGSYAEIFEPEGKPLGAGDILRQSRLAETLEVIGREGPDSFYRGALAAELAADLAELDSPVAASDLSAHRATRPFPLHCRVRGGRLFNTAPPTQGVASLMILCLYDRLPHFPEESSDFVHALVEATKVAFTERDKVVGDPDFMPVPAQEMLRADRLDRLATTIDLQRARAWPHRPDAGDTTWFGAADARGQVVSAIQSTYFEFGSGLVLPRTGITWHNRGASFRLARDGWNALYPGRRPFHTLNPAIATFDDGRVMAYGSMGGDGQPQTQAAIFTRYAGGMDLQKAISAPRWLLGRTWGEPSTTLKLESDCASPVIEALRKAGHDVELVAPCNPMMGHAGAIVRHANGNCEGASDPRSDGAALGERSDANDRK